MLLKKITAQIIKNKDLPVCVDCFYYIQGQFRNGTGKCTKFGEKDIILGKVSYTSALVCRNEDDLCSTRGYYWQPK
uniref:Uncharacterized protein n=1 Tax=viral metagenome TaxID=1070528 RepID=A0A6C0JEQ9_9ZZZZ